MNPTKTQLKSKSNSWVATIINKLMVHHFFDVATVQSTSVDDVV